MHRCDVKIWLWNTISRILVAWGRVSSSFTKGMLKSWILVELEKEGKGYFRFMDGTYTKFHSKRVFSNPGSF